MDLGWFLVTRLLCVYMDTSLNITVIYHILSLFNAVKCLYKCTYALLFYKLTQFGSPAQIYTTIQKIGVSFFKETNQGILEKKDITVFTVVQLFSAARNVSWAPNQHIRIIPEGSCDSKTWLLLLKIQLCHHRNKLNFFIKYITFILIIMKLFKITVCAAFFIK